MRIDCAVNGRRVYTTQSSYSTTECASSASRCVGVSSSPQLLSACDGQRQPRHQNEQQQWPQLLFMFFWSSACRPARSTSSVIRAPAAAPLRWGPNGSEASIAPATTHARPKSASDMTPIGAGGA